MPFTGIRKPAESAARLRRRSLHRRAEVDRLRHGVAPQRSPGVTDRCRRSGNGVRSADQPYVLQTYGGATNGIVQWRARTSVYSLRMRLGPAAENRHVQVECTGGRVSGTTVITMPRISERTGGRTTRDRRRSDWNHRRRAG